MHHRRCLSAPVYTANNFHLCFLNKRFNQVSLLISTKYFQIIMFYLELWYSIEQVQYQMKPFSCQHREQHISKQNYVGQNVHSSRLEQQRWSLEFVISSFKVYILDWGMANSIWDHVIQISIRQMNFRYIFT
jgi:hypothetical protein